MKRKWVVFSVKNVGDLATRHFLYDVECIKPNRTKRYKETRNKILLSPEFRGVGYTSIVEDFPFIIK